MMKFNRIQELIENFGIDFIIHPIKCDKLSKLMDEAIEVIRRAYEDLNRSFVIYKGPTHAVISISPRSVYACNIIATAVVSVDIKRSFVVVEFSYSSREFGDNSLLAGVNNLEERLKRLHTTIELSIDKNEEIVYNLYTIGNKPNILFSKYDNETFPWKMALSRAVDLFSIDLSIS